MLAKLLFSHVLSIHTFLSLFMYWFERILEIAQCHVTRMCNNCRCTLCIFESHFPSFWESFQCSMAFFIYYVNTLKFWKVGKMYLRLNRVILLASGLALLWKIKLEGFGSLHKLCILLFGMIFFTLFHVCCTWKADYSQISMATFIAERIPL